MSIVEKPIFVVMKREFFITEDGSHSLFVPELQEQYHSQHGAIQESKHIYIKSGLDQLISQNRAEISLFEMGFGTGLNAYLTALRAEECKQFICYHTVERYPLSSAEYSKLNYPKLLENHDSSDLFNAIHQAPWGEEIQISPFFKLKKECSSLETYKFSKTVDVIYFDAFAPDIQPELWGSDIFSTLYAQMNPDSYLVTYCAKGAVRRRLKEVGFLVERLAGPPGKREILRAKRC